MSQQSGDRGEGRVLRGLRFGATIIALGFINGVQDLRCRAQGINS